MTVVQRGMLVTMGVSLAAGMLFAAGERKSAVGNPEEQLPALMLAKLASSQKVVSGLVSEDFGEIRKGAEELIRVCDATNWAAPSDQIYAHHRNELRRQAHKLVKMADEQNLDGAAFTYMHSLTTCISCHQYCRDELRIATEPPLTEKVVPIPVTEEIPRRLDDRPLRR